MKYLFSLLLLTSCSDRVNPVTLSPKHFKVQFNHESYAPTVMLPVYLGNNKYTLQFDNHSPTWVNDKIIAENRSVRKLKNTSYSTSVADGSKIQGDVYICDSVTIGGLHLNDVLMYKISDTGDRKIGVIGENIISLGVWMIDFEYNKLIFASSADSLGKKVIYESHLLPTTFKNNTFSVEPVINGVKKKFYVDIGFNGEAILPLDDFKEICDSKKTVSHHATFSTPNGKQNLDNLTSYEKILLGTDSVAFVFTTNEKVAESVVGLGFFRQFHFVILDYPNKQIYVSIK
jgi:hypothetical protein